MTKLAGISLVICGILICSSAYAQNEWRFDDETSLRLPDVATLADRMDVGDVDGDNDLDIIVGCSDIPWPYIPGYEQIFINNATGLFTQENVFRLPLIDDVTATILLFDIDMDNDLDMFVGNSIQDSSYLSINDGSGHFSYGNGRIPTIIGTHQGIDFGDVDNDSDLDIYIAINSYPDVLLLNDGFGYFHTAPDRIPDIIDGSVTIRMADFDCDFDLDILLVNYGDSPRLLINIGNGFYIDDIQGRLEADYGRFGGVNDIDTDGDIDILIITQQNCLVFVNNGLGYFEDESDLRFPDINIVGGDVLTFADVDNDGDEDIGLGCYGYTLDYLLINNGNGYYEDQTDMRFPIQIKSTRDAVLADFDGDKDVDYFRVGDASCRNSIYINSINSADTIAPVFQNVEIMDDTIMYSGPYPIRCFINDGISLEKQQVAVTLYYSYDSTSFTQLQMMYSGGFMFRAELPEMDSGATVCYYITASDNNNNFSLSPPLAPADVYSFIYLPNTTGIYETVLPEEKSIFCYPNPFNSSVTISTIDPKGGESVIRLFNLSGMLIRTLTTKEGSAVWDATDYSGRSVSSGIYFARVESGDFSSTKKVLYLR